MNSSTATDYCASQTSQHDKERYLSALFAGEAQRASLFALYAFNLEIAKTRESVSEPMLGEIRLQWWREAIDEIYEGRPRRHEVVEALATAIGAHDLPKQLFHQIIDARTFDIYDEPMATFGDLIDYAASTSQSLMKLAALCLTEGRPLSDEEKVVLRHLGIAYGLAGVLRAFHFHASQGLVLVPSDLLGEPAALREAILSGRWDKGIHAALKQIATKAEEHYRDGKRDFRRTRTIIRPALLPAAGVMSNIKRVRRGAFNAFEEPVDAPQYLRQLQMLWAQVTGRI